jgi:hypothetical protein
VFFQVDEDTDFAALVVGDELDSTHDFIFPQVMASALCNSAAGLTALGWSIEFVGFAKESRQAVPFSPFSPFQPLNGIRDECGAA